MNNWIKRPARNFENNIRTPGKIKCPNCGNTFNIIPTGDFSCKCNQEFNIFGQDLAPRHFWGEETGETYDDIVRPLSQKEEDFGVDY